MSIFYTFLHSLYICTRSILIIFRQNKTFLNKKPIIWRIIPRAKAGYFLFFSDFCLDGHRRRGYTQYVLLIIIEAVVHCS